MKFKSPPQEGVAAREFKVQERSDCHSSDDKAIANYSLTPCRNHGDRRLSSVCAEKVIKANFMEEMTKPTEKRPDHTEKFSANYSLTHCHTYLHKQLSSTSHEKLHNADKKTMPI